MTNWLRNESKILFTAIFIGMVFALFVAAYTFVYSVTTQRDIAENVIRFHVMANSDSLDDQELKNLITSEILDEFADILSSQTSIEETRALFEEILPEMQAYAENIIREAGFDYDVSAEMANLFFPTQFYGDIAFPPGIYEAVQIKIGEASGENWWCLMFPPLCYVEMTAPEESRQQLAETVSDESLRLLMYQDDPTPEVVVRFRIVEWWQNLWESQPDNNSQPNPQIAGR